MHNLHLVVTKAESPEDACELVSDETMDWGTDNNWRTICGCVSEDDEVFIKDEGRYPPYNGLDTIEKINNWVKGLAGGKGNWSYIPEVSYKAMQKALGGKPLDIGDTYNISQFVKHAQSLIRLKYDLNDFNVLNGDEWFANDYVELGVTSNLWLNENEHRQMKKYVVFIDMHS